ncbi:MAG: hypothetical protein HKN67_03910, partial [Saprospiraceae bacterium]|nr:hypothetical protein [Saprospiraceae bacterium]
HNGEHGDTDLDLHLKGPNNIWVYYDDPGDETGKIILDRDVISDPGPVQENICAQYLDDMPSGEYQVLVNHYDGQEKSFQVRVIRGNNSSSYQGSLSPGDPDKLITTFTIE